MSDDVTAEAGSIENGSDAGGGDGFKPITTQDDLNRIIQGRIERERAKYADYDALKAEVGELTTARDALTAERDELSGQIQAAQAAEARKALLASVAESTGLSVAQVENLRGDDAESLAAAAQAVIADGGVLTHVLSTRGETLGSAGNDVNTEFLNKLFG